MTGTGHFVGRTRTLGRLPSVWARSMLSLLPSATKQSEVANRDHTALTVLVAAILAILPLRGEIGLYVSAAVIVLFGVSAIYAKSTRAFSHLVAAVTVYAIGAVLGQNGQPLPMAVVMTIGSGVILLSYYGGKARLGALVIVLVGALHAVAAQPRQRQRPRRRDPTTEVGAVTENHTVADPIQRAVDADWERPRRTTRAASPVVAPQPEGLAGGSEGSDGRGASQTTRSADETNWCEPGALERSLDIALAERDLNPQPIMDELTVEWE